MTEDTVITAAEAADLRPEHRNTIHHWCRKGWIKSAYKSGRVWLMSRSEILDFIPPRPGWRANTPRCPDCGEALIEGHICNPEQVERWAQRGA